VRKIIAKIDWMLVLIIFTGSLLCIAVAGRAIFKNKDTPHKDVALQQRVELLERNVRANRELLKNICNRVNLKVDERIQEGDFVVGGTGRTIRRER
jgi:uncharacterized membrane protein